MSLTVGQIVQSHKITWNEEREYMQWYIYYHMCRLEWEQVIVQNYSSFPRSLSLNTLLSIHRFSLKKMADCSHCQVIQDQS